MIQRIQTVYLLITAILMGIALYFPLCEVIDYNDITVMYHSFGIGEITGNEKPVWVDNVFNIAWGALTFTLLSILTPLVAIFLYKNRKIQARVTLLGALCIVIYYVAVIAYLLAFTNKLELSDSQDIGISISITSIVIFLPLIALIFDLLAYKRIKKDDKLVKSLDRIR